MQFSAADRPITSAPHGHILTNVNVWSPDSRRIVYDIRSDAEGSRFDGTRIECVDVETGEVRVLYESTRGAKCGAATYHPSEEKVIFIHGPENPSADWSYGPTHRRGVIVDASRGHEAANLDACDIVAPYTPGALRGGSHVHVFSSDGEWVSFTYEDHVLAAFEEENALQQINLRGIGVSAPHSLISVKHRHPRNHDGTYFSVLVARLTAQPRPGSDDVQKAFEESWVGGAGYTNTDGKRQKRALAFQGHVVDEQGRTVSEVFIVDLPEDLTAPGEGPLEGTATTRPCPPKGTVQRRLTYTATRRHPGVQGPRHWLRSSPDGSRIAFLMRDERGVVQLWTIAPTGGEPTRITDNAHDVASAFTWNPDGRSIAHVMDGSICRTEVDSGRTIRLTRKSLESPRPEACVISPDGRRIAYVRRVAAEGGCHNQVFVCDL